MKVGEAFKPDKELMKLYYAYLLIADAVVIVAVVIPTVTAAFFLVSLDMFLIVTVSLALPFLPIVGFAAYWIPKYYSSIGYMFTDGEIVVERGIWWKHKSTVPYSRVTNIDVAQGPLSRRYGVAKIRVQTAGYSYAGGGGEATAEATIFGVKNFEEIRSFILGKVRWVRPQAVEAGLEAAATGEAAELMLEELRKIREILEEQAARKNAVKPEEA